MIDTLKNHADRPDCSQAPNAVDALSDILKSVQLKGALYYRSELSAPWGMAVPQTDAAQFHVIRRGRCYLRGHQPGKPPVLLESGDLIVLTNGQPHELADSRSSSARPLSEILRIASREHNDCQAPLIYGGGGAVTTLICGYFAFTSGHAHPLLSVLPPVIHIKGDGGRPLRWLDAILELLAEEMRTRRPGADIVMNRLVETMLIQVMRTYLTASETLSASWFAGLKDPHIGQALGIIHRNPETTWNIDTLASSVGMSRSGFAIRFKTLTGEPPMQYLTRWRMEVAASHLRKGELSIGQIADRVGYRAEAAFSRVFKKMWGISPGAYRRNPRATTGGSGAPRQ